MVQEKSRILFDNRELKEWTADLPPGQLETSTAQQKALYTLPWPQECPDSFTECTFSNGPLQLYHSECSAFNADGPHLEGPPPTHSD